MKPPVIRNPEDRFQRDVRDAIAALVGVPILDGVLVKDVALTTGTTRVAHGLGRPAVGFWVVDSTADVRVWRDAANVAAPERTIPLRASTAATVTLWVF